MRHLIFALTVLTCASACAADWPQAGCVPQRTNRNAKEPSPEPGTEWRFRWTRNFWPDRVHNAAQAVVVGDRVYVGSKDGTVFCLNAADGKDAWATRGLGCIVNTLACVQGVVIAASLEGVHGLDAGSGEKKWCVPGPGGFTVAPLVAEDRVFVGSRLGTMFCLDAGGGNVVWKRDIGAPILQSAAWDGGRLFVATEDLFMRCLDAKSGKEVWKSGPFRSQSFVHFYPVIHEGHVLFRGMATQLTLGWDAGEYPFCYGWDARGKEIVEIAPKVAQLLAEKQPLPPSLEWEAGQVKMLERIKNNPWHQDLWVLDANSGKEAFLIPHFPGVGSLGMGGPLAPPAVDRDGLVAIQTVFGGHNFGRVDLKLQRIVDLLLDRDNKVRIEGNPDEYRSISTAGDEIFMAHEGEKEGAVRLRHGVFDLRTRKWTRRPEGFPRGSGSWFEHQGAPVAIANGRYFHISYNQMNAYGWQ